MHTHTGRVWSVKQAGLTWYVRLGMVKIAIADCVQVSDHELSITRINTPVLSRRQGIGTALLKAICCYADKTNQTLTLAAEASDGLTNDQLVQWYRKHGFVSSKEEPRLMTRPRVCEDTEVPFG